MSYQTDMTGNNCGNQKDNNGQVQVQKREHCQNLKPCYNSGITEICECLNNGCG